MPVPAMHAAPSGNRPSWGACWAPGGTQPGNGLGRALVDVTEALERLSGHHA
jgi:hypothetical protein